MIKLENISMERLISYVKQLSQRDVTMKYIYNLLVEYEIYDYQRLKDLLDSGNIKIDEARGFLIRELFEIQNDIKMANLNGYDSEIFSFDMYKNSEVDDRTLRITDSSNNGDVLLYTCPMVRGGARINQLKYMSIEHIKYLSSHLSSYNLENALTFKRNFGITTVKRVVDCVNFYEQQVLRQANETSECGINLFMLNKKEKDEIVESQIKDIVEYLVDNASVCVWGNLPSSKKIEMLRSIFAVRGEYLLENRQRLINAISNYTTLSELEEGIVKKKTLDRFIVR